MKARETAPTHPSIRSHHQVRDPSCFRPARQYYRNQNHSTTHSATHSHPPSDTWSTRQTFQKHPSPSAERPSTPCGCRPKNHQSAHQRAGTSARVKIPPKPGKPLHSTSHHPATSPHPPRSSSRRHTPTSGASPPRRHHPPDSSHSDQRTASSPAQIGSAPAHPKTNHPPKYTPTRRLHRKCPQTARPESAPNTSGSVHSCAPLSPLPHRAKPPSHPRTPPLDDDKKYTPAPWAQTGLYP